MKIDDFSPRHLMCACCIITSIFPDLFSFTVMFGLLAICFTIEDMFSIYLEREQKIDEMDQPITSYYTLTGTSPTKTSE